VTYLLAIALAPLVTVIGFLVLLFDVALL